MPACCASASPTASSITATMHDCWPNSASTATASSVPSRLASSRNKITNGPQQRTAMNAPQAPPPWKMSRVRPTRARSRSTRSASSRSAIRSRSRTRPAACNIRSPSSTCTSACRTISRARTCRASSRSSTATSARFRSRTSGDAGSSMVERLEAEQPRRDELPYQ